MATRHERVIIDLEDRFTMPAARMAAGTAMFRKNLDDSGRSIIAFDKTVKESGASIDKLSGRLGLLTRAAAALGPGLAPITTAMVPAIAGLSTQLGFAAAGAGTAVLAFKGVGDALGALNDYQLEPSAENFAKLQEQMRNLGPAAQEFVYYLDQISPQLQTIRQAAQDGLLPGAQEGLESLMTRLPQVRNIVSEIASATGDLMASAGQDLASGSWDKFFNFLETEARPTLLELGETTGNVAKGIAELWMALNPLSDDFTSGLLDASAAFEQWATDLSGTQGFQEFMAYIRETGPQVLDTIGSLANMLLQVAEAAAPMGGPILTALEAVADVIAAIADSDIGTPLLAAVGAMSALSLASAGFSKVTGSAAVGSVRALTTDLKTMGSVGIVSWARTTEGAEKYAAASGRIRASLAGLGKQAAVVGGLAIATSGLAESTGLSNTASMALMGTIAGPWGAAIGGGIGLAMDFAAANNDLQAAIEGANQAAESGSLDQMKAQLASLKASVADQGWMSEMVSGMSGASREAEEAIAILESEISKAEDSTGGLASVFGSALAPALGLTSDAFGTAAASADEFRSSLVQVEGVLDKRASLRAYRDSLRQFAEAAKEAPANMRPGSEAADNMQAALDQIASNALRAAENLRGMGRVQFLQGARKDFIDAAVDMGKTARQAENLADRLGLVDRSDPKVKVSEDGAEATGKKIDAVQGKADKLDQSKTFAELWAEDNASKDIERVRGRLGVLDATRANPNITVQDRASGTIAAVQARINAMYGKTIVVRTVHMDTRLTATNRASGGLITGPGTGTSDDIPAWLSNGEYVIKAAAVAKYGVDTMHRINAMKYASGGYVQRFAEGGQAKKRDPFTGKEYARESREFNLTGDQSWREVRAAIRDFAREVREAGGHVGRNFDRLSTRAVNVSRALDKHEKALDKARERLGQLRTDRRDYASEVAGTYRHDLFGNGAAGLLLQLQADTNDANSMRAALAQGARRGLDGGLYKALAASGDLNTAQQLARMSRGQIAQYESAYASRQSTTGALGTQAADKVYSASIRQMERAVNAQVRATTKLERRLEGLESAVERGARRGVGDRDRNASTRRRAGK